MGHSGPEQDETGNGFRPEPHSTQQCATAVPRHGPERPSAEATEPKLQPAESERRPATQPQGDSAEYTDDTMNTF